MFCLCFHTMATAMTMATAGPIRREHSPDDGIAALHEATNMLHWAMCLTLYLPGGMVVAITIDSVTFYYIVVVELNLLQLQGYFNLIIETLQPYPRPTPSDEVTHIRLGVSIDTTRRRGKRTTMVVMFVGLLC